MFELLRRLTTKTKQSKAAPRLARPRLEVLEGREVPAALTLSVAYGMGRQITLSGTLSDHPNPSLQTITICGRANALAMTNMQGQFSVTVEANGLGTVSATAADHSTNTPTVTLTDAPISLTLNAVEGAGHLWTLSGDVTYARGLTWMTVLFGGTPVSLQYWMAGTNSSGHYETGVMLNGTPSDNGTVWAKVFSPWGTVSELALDTISQTGT
jgi:hypothetical protein